MTTAIGIAAVIWGAFHASGLATASLPKEESLRIMHNISLAVTTAAIVFGAAIAIGANL